MDHPVWTGWIDRRLANIGSWQFLQGFKRGADLMDEDMHWLN